MESVDILYAIFLFFFFSFLIISESPESFQTLLLAPLLRPYVCAQQKRNIVANWRYTWKIYDYLMIPQLYTAI